MFPRQRLEIVCVGLSRDTLLPRYMRGDVSESVSSRDLDPPSELTEHNNMLQIGPRPASFLSLFTTVNVGKNIDVPSFMNILYKRNRTITMYGHDNV